MKVIYGSSVSIFHLVDDFIVVLLTFRLVELGTVETKLRHYNEIYPFQFYGTLIS